MSDFDAVFLPSEVKEELCRELLADLGVTKIIKTSRGELKHQCVMPWHDDRNPSAQLNFEKLVYSCFSCGSSGGFLWLLSTALSTTGDGAREWIDTKSGMGPGDEFSLSALLSMFDAIAASGDGQPASDPIPKISTKAIEPWVGLIHPILTTGVPEVGLEGRGIPEQNLIDMQVGYAEAYPIGEETSERIVIPHFWQGNLVGWQSRRVWDDGTPKYLSTVGMPKDSTIFDHDPSRGTAVVVESPMSVLRHRHHLPMCSTFGASVTDRQVSVLADYRRIILWMDNDKAGWGSTMDLGPRLEAYTQVDVVESSWAADAADMDDATAADLVEGATPFALWDSPAQLVCWVCKTAHSGPCNKERG